MTTIDKTTKSVAFTVENPGTGDPVLRILRIGSSASKTITLRYINKVGNKYHFAVDPGALNPGRYYVKLSFGGCCCLSTEVYVDSSCKLTDIQTSKASCQVCTTTVEPSTPPPPPTPF